jgi:RNA polymerase sigma factor (sigma-70 family)
MSTDNIHLVLKSCPGIPSDAEAHRLAVAAGHGDKTARDKLIIGNLPLISFILDRLNVPVGLKDDCFQQACIGMMRAVEKYNPEHSSGSVFSSYAFWWIRQAIQSVMQKRMKQITHEKEMDDELTVETEHHFPDEEIDVKRLLRCVNRRERLALTNISEGRHLSELGDELGVCKERVRQIKEEALEKLRERMKL